MLTEAEVEWLREGHRDVFGNQVERVERILRERMAKAWDEGYEANDNRVRSFENPYR